MEFFGWSKPRSSRESHQSNQSPQIEFDRSLLDQASQLLAVAISGRRDERGRISPLGRLRAFRTLSDQRSSADRATSYRTTFLAASNVSVASSRRSWKSWRVKLLSPVAITARGRLLGCCCRVSRDASLCPAARGLLSSRSWKTASISPPVSAADAASSVSGANGNR